MLRTALSLTLIVTQAVLAAPLYVCSSASGEVRLDGGPAACAGCERHSPSARACENGCCSGVTSDSATVTCGLQTAPCSCRHQPLNNDRQLVRRIDNEPHGGLLVADLGATSDLLPGRPISIQAYAITAFSAAHSSLTDQASVRLRC
jgi:hypothetical protein